MSLSVPTDQTLDRLISTALSHHRKQHHENPALIRMSRRPFQRSQDARWNGLSAFRLWDQFLDTRKDKKGREIDTVITVASGQDNGGFKL